MRNKKAKMFRRTAERMTVGKSKKETRRVYQQLKSTYKELKAEA